MGLLLIATLICTTQPAHAATLTQLINITPSSTAISVDPGASAQGSFDVINKGSDSLTLALSSAPYRVTGHSYNPSFTQLPGTVNASQWIKFNSVTTQTIAPQKLLAADYTVTVPAGTAPGGYYAVIFAQSASPNDKSGVIPEGRVGDILYITVNGTVKISGSLTASNLPFFSAGTPISIGVLVGNDGGLHFQSAVNVTVKDIFGKTVFTKTDNVYILPQTERQVSETWTPTAPIGLYHIERSASLPDVGRKQLMNRIVIVVQPWVFIGIAGLVLVVVALIMILRQHNRRRMP